MLVEPLRLDRDDPVAAPPERLGEQPALAPEAADDRVGAADPNSQRPRLVAEQQRGGNQRRRERDCRRQEPGDVELPGNGRRNIARLQDEELEGEVEEVGGRAVLSDCIEMAPESVNAEADRRQRQDGEYEPVELTARDALAAASTRCTEVRTQTGFA